MGRARGFILERDAIGSAVLGNQAFEDTDAVQFHEEAFAQGDYGHMGHRVHEDEAHGHHTAQASSRDRHHVTFDQNNKFADHRDHRIAQQQTASKQRAEKDEDAVTQLIHANA